MTLRILHVEDEPALARLLKEYLRMALQEPYELTWVPRLAEATQLLTSQTFELVLLDLGLPDSHGLETFRTLHNLVPQTPIIVLSGLDDESTALQALQSGAQDYLVKINIDSNLLVRAVRYAIERKKVEVALSVERDLLHALTENLPDQIYMKDSTGHFIRTNSATAHALGVESPEALLGKTDFDFFPAEVAQQFADEEQQILCAKHKLVNREYCQELPDGKIQWDLTTKAPLYDQRGKIIGIVGINRDITFVKQAEHELRQANAQLESSQQELKTSLAELQKAHTDLHAMQLQLVEVEKMRTIGRLAAGVAHEVKNPLAILLRGLDFLTLSLKQSDETVAEVLKDMQEAIRRADTVIRGLLDFSAPTNLETQPEDLNAIIRQALFLLKHMLQEHHIQIKLMLAPELPSIPLDRQKITEVFLNLFENAIHAMPSSGTLTVRTTTQLLTTTANAMDFLKIGDLVVKVEIEDTGAGIPVDNLDKVFAPFFTTKPAGQGTGLGLSVCKTIIDLHHSTIGVENRPEGGVCVTILFSATDRRAAM